MLSRFKNEELRESFEIFHTAYLEGYRNRVLEVYSDENTQGTSFTYMKPVLFTVLLRGIDTHLVISRNENDDLSFVDLNEMTEEDFCLLSSSSVKLRRDFIKSTANLDEYLEEMKIHELGKFSGISFKKENRPHLASAAKRWGAEKADSHYNNYQFVEAFGQAISPSMQLTTVNTDEILEKVKDPSFQYEFGESAKAYNAELYLAAASTAGIALENILRIIIVKRMKDNVLPKNSFIRDSVLKLDKENILPGRLRSRVWEKNGIRNSHSHTNEDPVRKETVESLHLIIEDLVPYTF